MMNNEIFEMVTEMKEIGKSLRDLSIFFNAYGKLMDGMGLTDRDTVEFVNSSIKKTIEEQKELDAQKAEDAEAEAAGKKTRLDLELENEYLTKKVKRLEEELESAYADLGDKED